MIMTATPTKLQRLKQKWQTEGAMGLALWATNWALWKTRAYYAMPEPMAEEVQARFRYARREKKFGIHDPIIVYQMGKVGSMSVYRALRELRLDVPVYHLHSLNGLEEQAEWLAEKRDTTPKTLERMRVAQKLRREIERGTAPRYNLVSLVRAPVPHAVSAFCHRLDLHFPDLETRLAQNTLAMSDLTNYFISQFHDDLPLRWFEEQVNALFGIDVYAEPFVRERGYQIYSSPRARMLLLRGEDLNKVAGAAFQEFLGIPNVTVGNINTGEANRFGQIYKEFRAALVLPRNYIDQAHSSRYAQHFYTPEELEASVARWAEPRGHD